MKLVKIAPYENGAHANQTINHLSRSNVPQGWAIIPEDMVCENFPYGEIEASEIDGAMVVTKWTAIELPEPEPTPEIEPEPTAQDDTDMLLIDHEYRLTLLELGV